MIGRARFAFAVLGFGYAFLYLPLALVMIYSFNESRLVTVWGGFSTKWWSTLLANEAMLQAAWLSLRIAFVSATGATLIGLAAGYALARATSFPGRSLFGGMVIAPMVMPTAATSTPMVLLLKSSFMANDALATICSRAYPEKYGHLNHCPLMTDFRLPLTFSPG